MIANPGAPRSELHFIEEAPEAPQRQRLKRERVLLCCLEAAAFVSVCAAPSLLLPPLRRLHPGSRLQYAIVYSLAARYGVGDCHVAFCSGGLAKLNPSLSAFVHEGRGDCRLRSGLD